MKQLWFWFDFDFWNLITEIYNSNGDKIFSRNIESNYVSTTQTLFRKDRSKTTRECPEPLPLELILWVMVDLIIFFFSFIHRGGRKFQIERKSQMTARAAWCWCGFMCCCVPVFNIKSLMIFLKEISCKEPNEQLYFFI